MPVASTAILLFSRSASAEAEHKSFGAGALGDQRIAAGLIQRTEATLAKIGLPVFRSTEADQIGATFGQRLSSAMARVFGAGFERVIVVGNDCPSIRPAHLRAAAHILAQGKNVLGPDQRGGVWLIGLQRKDFAAAPFAALPWETARVFGELRQVLPALTSLVRRADLNALHDLRRFWCQLRHVLGRLFALVFGRSDSWSVACLRPPLVVVHPSSGRGPPRGVGL